MPNPFAKGFENQPEEIAIDALPITGDIPTWLRGTFVRNGPGQFDVKGQSYRHWFDGLAMLLSFRFQDGQVSYRNRYLRSDSYLRDRATGKVNYRGFAVDPCMTFFRKLFSFFAPEPNDLPNAVVSVQQVADRFIAMTESPMAVEFDPETLQTLGKFDFGTPIDAQTATAHPHYDFERELGYNYSLRMSNRSAYQIYAIKGTKRRLLGQMPVQQPGYIHSFAMTPRYVVLAENALRLPDLRALMDLAFVNKPFIENFRWLPETGSRFIVFDKDSGKVVRTLETDAFFVFHTINAYEEGEQIVLDMATYDHADLINSFYLGQLRGDGYPRYSGQFRRYRLPLNNGKSAHYEIVTDESLDLPRINYRKANMQPYSSAYGVGLRKGSNEFVDQLVKVEPRTGTTHTWHTPGHYPGEPIFVAAPDAQAEDEGVVLSVVLDAAQGTSYLLVLDAQTFSQIARADVPHHIPFGFHGQFFGNAGAAED